MSDDDAKNAWENGSLHGFIIKGPYEETEHDLVKKNDPDELETTFTEP